jgi:hypothetical protein
MKRTYARSESVMAVTEKLFTGEVAMMYPKQWVVMTELESQTNPYKLVGVVHYVSPNEDDARSVLRSLRADENSGRSCIVEGWNDTPQIGGLELWNR